MVVKNLITGEETYVPDIVMEPESENTTPPTLEEVVVGLVDTLAEKGILP